MAFKNYLEVIAHCDKFPYNVNDDPESPFARATAIVFQGHVIGHVLPDVLPALKEYNESKSPSPFVIQETIQFNNWVDSFEKRTQVVKELMDTWRENKVMKALAG